MRDDSNVSHSISVQLKQKYGTMEWENCNECQQLQRTLMKEAVIKDMLHLFRICQEENKKSGLSEAF